MEIVIGNDHGGLELKNRLKSYLQERGIKTLDVGSHSAESSDFPDYGFLVAKSMSEGTADNGVAICSTGSGMSMVANKVKGIRAALCLDIEQAIQSRSHLDANLLVLRGNIEPGLAIEILETFLKTDFSGLKRYKRRISKIHHLTGV